MPRMTGTTARPQARANARCSPCSSGSIPARGGSVSGPQTRVPATTGRHLTERLASHRLSRGIQLHIKGDVLIETGTGNRAGCPDSGRAQFFVPPGNSPSTRRRGFSNGTEISRKNRALQHPACNNPATRDRPVAQSTQRVALSGAHPSSRLGHALRSHGRKEASPKMPDTYEEACRAHALAQGLGPPSLELRANGFKPEILQTGGFCMVIQAYRDSTVQVWVTQDETVMDDAGELVQALYLVCAYRPPAESPEESGVYDGEEELASKYGVPLSRLTETVTAYALEVFDV